jgi:16S rRNA processing protein RimM
VLVGRLTGCFGIRGYLKLELAGKSPERAKKLRRVFLGRTPADAELFTVGDVKLEGGRVLVLMKDVEDRTGAEALRGKLVFVEPSESVPPPEGGYYIHDLIGCEVRTTGGTVVGRVEDVLETPGQHLWAVRDGEIVRHIPAVKDFVVSVDTGKKEIIVDLPDGLLDQ